MAITSPNPRVPTDTRATAARASDVRRRDLGRRGEDAVAAWYTTAGYDVVARNWRCASGEIDLVALGPDGVVVVCEVKTRSSTAYGSPLEAVTVTKQRRLRQLAARWLSEDRRGAWRIRPVQFDVAAVLEQRTGELHIDVLHDAF